MSEEKGKGKGYIKAETGLPQWMTEDSLLYSMKKRPIKIEAELPQWMIDKAEEKHIDLSKVLTEEAERLDREERER